MTEIEGPPFKGIHNLLTNGSVIPFLGSGASLSGGGQLNWVEGAEDCLPTAQQLARHLARIGNYPTEAHRSRVHDAPGHPLPDSGPEPTVRNSASGDEEDLPEDPWIPELRKAAQYITLSLGRNDLVGYLDDIFRAKPALGELHRYLAGLAPPEGKPLIIITTNYDDLVERAFAEENKKYLLVVHTAGRHRGDKLLVRVSDGVYREEDASDITEIEGLDAVIYKMHGSIRREASEAGEYVITDDDYVDFLTRMTRWTVIPALMNEPLKLNRFLFLGYGLEDWNLRVLLSQLADSQIQMRGDRKNWAIQKGPSLFDQSYWADKGVKVYDMTIDAFVSGLRAEAGPRPSP